MQSNGPYLGVIRPDSVFGRTREKMTTQEWLRNKQMDDGAEGLWRIHDDIYDFSGFVKNHPGGQFWLEVTKGTDITEAFETHHVTDKAEALLGKYRLKKARKPKISLITFKEKGFYKTLKRKIQKSGLVSSTGPSWQSRALIDSLLFGFLVAALLGVRYSYWWSLISGFFLYMVCVAAHTFFHMRDNVRMYYFNLSLLSFRDWRISHALSHHPYANTFLDLEISLFEPFFYYLPYSEKGYIRRFLPWLISPFVFTFLFAIEFLKRCGNVLIKAKPFHWDEYLALAVPIFMWMFSNETSKVLIAWGITIASGSFFFILVGLTAAHHHPEIYHEGDFLGEDKDFGLLQLAAVRDREEISGNFFLASITFGDHALHHLFPTVDHKTLVRFQSHFEETCKEFNIDFKLKTFGNLVTGMYQQLARNYLNANLFIKKYKLR